MRPSSPHVTLGLLLSALLVRETLGHAVAEAHSKETREVPAAPGDVFWRTSFTDRELSSVTQAGFINNLNDGLAWGLFPLVYAASGLALEQVGALAAVYPAVWGVAQLLTGALSDHLGRKWLIASGLWVQAGGIALLVAGRGTAIFVVSGVLLGLGTAMVYPTLLAAIGDVAHPSWRSSAVGVYRLWRDAGYAAGALVAGFTADALGVSAAIALVAILTGSSGTFVAVRMRETHGARRQAGQGR